MVIVMRPVLASVLVLLALPASAVRAAPPLPPLDYAGPDRLDLPRRAADLRRPHRRARRHVVVRVSGHDGRRRRRRC